jgi:hypothetical protein
VSQQPGPHQKCVGYEHGSSEESPCACEPRREGSWRSAVRISVVPSPISRIPGTPAPARSVGKLEPTEQMGEPVSAITRPRIASRNVVPTFATSTTAPVTVPIAPAASGSRQRAPSAARPHWKGDDPAEDPVHAHKVHQRRGRAVVMQGEGEPEDDRHHTAGDGDPDERHRPGRVPRAVRPVAVRLSGGARASAHRTPRGLFGVHARRPRG